MEKAVPSSVLDAPTLSYTSTAIEANYDSITPLFSGEKARIGDHTFSGPGRIYHLGGLIHRLDGPAIELDRDEGTETEWWHMGERHRGDGPAVTRADGTEEWWYRHNEVFVDGPSPEGIPSHLRSGAHYAFYAADQAKLVEAGVDIEEAIEIALDEDLSSVEAVLARLDGAPAEWARSYDEGRSL